MIGRTVRALFPLLMLPWFAQRLRDLDNGGTKHLGVVLVDV